MSNLEKVKNILLEKNASLVVYYKNGDIKEYYQDRIKNIKEILMQDETALKDAIIADKVIGKVAASILTVAGVKEIYADLISELAIPILEKNNIIFSFGKKVAFIKNKDNTGMCPMENKYKDEKDIKIIYKEIIGEKTEDKNIELNEYLKKINCRGCYNHCQLSSPICGRSKIFINEAIENLKTSKKIEL